MKKGIEGLSIRAYKSLVKRLQIENEVLKKLLETRKKSRYSKCFGLFRAIAKKYRLGDNHFGMLMAKNKTMKEFGIKNLKALSDDQLKGFELFLKWLAYTSSKIDILTYNLMLKKHGKNKS